MNHSFDVDIAKSCGVNCAILYENIRFWVAKNTANDKHYHDGEYWTYCSVKAFSDLFPYMTAKQIRTALAKLEEVGLVKCGNYNTAAYDHTKWYTVVKKGNGSCQLSNFPLPCEAFRFAPEGKPIPDINTDINTDIKKYKEKSLFGEFDNVKLTDAEHDKLIDSLGDIGCDKYIERLSTYLASKGDKYKSHYATILAWWRKDGSPVERSPKPYVMKPDKVREFTGDETLEEIFR